MAGLFPRLLAILGLLVLSACVMPDLGNGKGKAAAGPNPVTGGAIEVTALDDPSAKAPGKAAAGKEKAKPGKASEPVPDAAAAPPEPAPKAPATGPKPRPEKVEVAAAKAGEADAKPGEAADIPEPEAAPQVPQEAKSAAQIACEKKKGHIWAKAGSTGLQSCVKRTRDSGKRCTKGTQCEGDCLARSGTCAPYTPLFGCNEIFRDDGARETLCLN